jgi:hypothetical protein
MMVRYLAAGASFFCAACWANSAFALCLPLVGCLGGGGDGGGAAAAPEINASGAFAAIALLLSIGMIVYRRLQKH